MTDAPASGLTADEEVFRRLYPGLYRFAAVVGGRDTDPDDLVQEAVLRTLRRGSLSRLDAPTAYLRRAIVNLAADSRRESLRKARALVLLSEDEAVPATHVTGDVLELVEAPDRALLYLVDVERYTLKEAAHLLGVSHTAARSRASRARLRLRQQLEREGDS